MASTLFSNKRLLILSILVVMVGAFSAIESLPRLEDPIMVNRFATILTTLPGGSAERVESLVTERLERKLKDVSEIHEMISISRPGVSLINVELKDTIATSSIGAIWAKVRDRLEETISELPAEASRPRLDEVKGISAFTRVVSLTWDGPGEPNLALLSRRADDLADRLRLVKSTEFVMVTGQPEEEARVTVDPDRLANLGLSASDLATLIAQADAKKPAGVIRNGESTRFIEIEGRIDTLKRLASIPLREGSQGSLVRLGDIAEITKTYRQPPRELALINNQPALVVAARMDANSRVDRWSADVEQTLADYAADLPEGITLTTLFDQNVYTAERLQNLLFNLLQGVTVILAACLVTMGLRQALMISLALPLSVAATLFLMGLLKISIHQISMIGMIIALGLLIDNAIIVVDALSRRLKTETSPAAAVAATTRQLTVPLLASNLTTILAFLPIVLLTGAVGEFVGPLGWGVVLSLISSFTISLTILPALMAMLAVRDQRITHQAQDNGQSKLADDDFENLGFGRADASALADADSARCLSRRVWWRDGFHHSGLARGFAGLVAWTVRHPLVTLPFVLLPTLTGFGLAASGQLRDLFFPPVDRDTFYIQLRMPPGTSLEGTRRAAERANQIAKELAGPRLRQEVWFVGTTGPSVYYNMFMSEQDSPGYAQGVIWTHSPEETDWLIPRLQARLDAELPEARSLVRKLGQGPPIPAPIEIRLFSSNLEDLRRTGERIRAILAEVPTVIHTHAQLQGGDPKLWFQIAEDQARLTGLSLADVANQLQTILEGGVGGLLVEGVEDLPVRVRVADERRSDLERITALNLLTPGSTVADDLSNAEESRRERVTWTPLSALGQFDLRPELDGIPRRDARRCNTIQGFIKADALPSEAVKVFRARLEEVPDLLPPGVTLEYGGDSAEQAEAIDKLAAYVPVLVVVMATVVILSFGSTRLAAIIVVVAVCSIGQGMLMVWLFDHPFGFMAVLGTAGLIGVAVNDSILVLSELRHDPKAAAGEPTATGEVVLTSLRHVVATTLTTLGGFLPLILAGGKFWPPLAIVMGGGVALSTLSALFLVPPLHGLIVRLSNAVGLPVPGSPTPEPPPQDPRGIVKRWHRFRLARRAARLDAPRQLALASKRLGQEDRPD